MLNRRTFLGAALALTAATGLTLALLPNHNAQAAGHAQKARKHLLIVTATNGFRHDSIPTAEETIERIGNETKLWDCDFARNFDEIAQKMTAASLQKYDAVVFANSQSSPGKEFPLPDPQGFLDYIKAGHGFVGTHSASDTLHNWPGDPPDKRSAYVEMLGGEFQVHHHQCAVDAHILDPDHPATKGLVKASSSPTTPVTDEQLQQGKSVVTDHTWKVYDEIYLFKYTDRPNLHVLLAMDKHPNDGSPEANQPGEYLISWCKSYGKGRVFFTSLGHRQEMWHDPLYQKHITGGIKFALGLEKGATKPNPPQ